MSETGIRPRLVIILFFLACASVVMSSVLILSLFLRSMPASSASASYDRLPAIEKSMGEQDWSRAWSLFVEASRDPAFGFSPRSIALLWELWQSDTNGAALVELSRNRFAARPAFDERVLLSYLLLQAGQGRLAAELTNPGEFREKFPVLDAELVKERNPAQAVTFSAVNAVDSVKDARVALDRALAFGYLGEYGMAKNEADQVIRATDPPGVNGTGMIDVSRGLCRRQIARVIQILSVWDAEEKGGSPLMKAAAKELMVDPDGLIQVAPRYFDILTDAMAWTGQRDDLFRLYRVADVHGHGLTVSQQETRSVIAHQPDMRPASYRDIRNILARGSAGDSRSLGPDLQEAAWAHNDQRSFRVLSWYLWSTGDHKGLIAVLDKNRINRGPWYDLYAGLLAESGTESVLARESLSAANHGYLEASANLNLARVRAIDGQLELAGSLAEEAINILSVRSLGEHLRRESAYSGLYLNALGLRARIFSLQGRAADAQALLKQIHLVDPQHPALYDASGISVSPETESELTRDTSEK